jgi:hypothetical protein
MRGLCADRVRIPIWNEAHFHPAALENPRLARGDQIVAVPTLVRKLPPPVKRIIGDLSASERVLVGLDLKRRVHP